MGNNKETDLHGNEKFKIICPKCQCDKVSFAHTIYDEIRIECNDCGHKEYI